MHHANLVVLGLLSEGPRHGYELTKRIDKMNLRQWAKVGNATLYSLLQRLERQEFLIKQVGRSGRRPSKNVFAFTARGRAKLKELVTQALNSRASAYSDRIVGMAFSWAPPPRLGGGAHADHRRPGRVGQTGDHQLAHGNNRPVVLRRRLQGRKAGRGEGARTGRPAASVREFPGRRVRRQS